MINEMMWPGTDLSASDEWIELYATGSGAQANFTLDGWILTTLNSKGIETPIYRFAPADQIGSGQYLMISHFDADHSRLVADPFGVTTDMSLPNAKLQLRLRDASGTIVDEADDGIGNPAAGDNPKAPLWKASMERISAFLSGTAPSNWKTASTFVGFDDGAPLFGTPGFPNGSGLRIDTLAPQEATDMHSSFQKAASGVNLTVTWTPSKSLDPHPARIEDRVGIRQYHPRRKAQSRRDCERVYCTKNEYRKFLCAFADVYRSLRQCFRRYIDFFGAL